MAELFLPSDNRRVLIRPVTVSLAMEANGHSKAYSEHYITKFLELIQEPGATKSDPKDWTVQDRYFVMFTAYLETFRSVESRLEETLTYRDCPACGKDHPVKLYYPDLADKITWLEGELPAFEFQGQSYQVHPLTGRVQEQVEQLEAPFPEPGSAEWGEFSKSDQAAAIRSQVQMTRLMGHLGKTLKDFEEMPYADFLEISKRVLPELAKLKHGIDFSIRFKCPNTPQAQEVPVPVPFRELSVFSAL